MTLATLAPLALLLAATTTQQVADGVLEDRRFYVTGWHCDDGGCSSNPRELGPELRFDVAWGAARLRAAKGSATAWDVTLNCRIAAERMTDCRVESDSRGSARDVAAARRLVRSLRLVPTRSVGHRGGRAIVTIRHATGDCPPWQCSPTPAPPAPPAR